MGVALRGIGGSEHRAGWSGGRTMTKQENLIYTHNWPRTLPDMSWFYRVVNYEDQLHYARQISSNRDR